MKKSFSIWECKFKILKIECLEIHILNLGLNESNPLFKLAMEFSTLKKRGYTISQIVFSLIEFCIKGKIQSSLDITKIHVT